MYNSAHQIAISGGIAVGKTTITKQLSKKLPNCITFIENPERNPFLADFYSDMKKWSFHSRIAMLALFAKRYKKIKNMFHQYEICLMDRCIHELMTFAILQYRKGNLTEREYNTYKEILDAFILLSPQLDIIIYLKCSPEVALERINLRGRLFETAVSFKYLIEIEQTYDEWISSLPSSIHVIHCNTDVDTNIDILVKSILNILYKKKERGEQV